MGTYIKYQVKMTPLVSLNTYGAEFDVSDKIGETSLRKLSSTIDAGDYDIGVYTFGDISLKAFNNDGTFNDENDSRSIFINGRDKAKVEITFTQVDDEVGDEIATIKFKGTINDEGTRQDIVDDTVRFKVLSSDSVIRNTKIPSGRVTSGSTIKVAMENILSDAAITSVLNVSPANINPDLNLVIDDGDVFTNKPTKDGLNELLFISNSAMLIDSNDNIIIKSRGEDTVKDIINLFGKSDTFSRENIVSIKNYNTGLHRTFTSVVINEQEKSNTGIGIDFGERQKSFKIDWLTEEGKEADSAQRILDEFKAPKIELEVEVATSVVNDVELLDRVSINYPLRVKPKGKFLPVVGLTEIDDAEEPLPGVFGSLSINPLIAFKVIRVRHNPRSFTTTLKLRQVGTELNDGQFNVPGSCIIGFAVIGECQLIDGNDCDQYNPSVVGAAFIGCTVIA